jgi:hypothetical protein
MAIFSFFRRITAFFTGAGFVRDLDFARFAFAANASPRWNTKQCGAGLSESKDYKVFLGRTGFRLSGFGSLDLPDLIATFAAA